MQALRKVMQSPKYANRRAQLAVEWEAKNKVNGSASGYKAAAASTKPVRRASAKAKAKGPALPPEAEKEIDEQCMSEVGGLVPCDL